MRIRLFSTVSFLVVCLFAAQLQAQISQTQLNAISPPGCQQGQSVDVKISSGKDLDDVSQLLFSHPGITAVQKMQDSGGMQVPVTNTFVVSVSADVSGRTVRSTNRRILRSEQSSHVCN